MKRTIEEDRYPTRKRKLTQPLYSRFGREYYTIEECFSRGMGNRLDIWKTECPVIRTTYTDALNIYLPSYHYANTEIAVKKRKKERDQMMLTFKKMDLVTHVPRDKILDHPIAYKIFEWMFACKSAGFNYIEVRDFKSGEYYFVQVSDTMKFPSENDLIRLQNVLINELRGCDQIRCWDCEDWFNTRNNYEKPNGLFSEPTVIISRKEIIEGKNFKESRKETDKIYDTNSKHF